jgi:hypothetical protein
MAKKTARTRNDNRTRINEAQLQAYRARKAETVAHHDAAPSEPAPSREKSAQPRVMTSWGNVDEEYAMIRSDLVRLFIITGAMFAIILILWFFLV